VLFAIRADPGAKPLTEAVDEFRQSAQGEGPSRSSRPDPGVYTAIGEGRAELSFPPLSQDDGPEMPVTVQHAGDACWFVRVDYNQAHWQTWEYCAGDASSEVEERGGETRQRWDLGATQIENTSTFTCDPASSMIDLTAQPGTTWQQACTGTNTQSSGTTTSTGPYTFVGQESLAIGTELAITLHYRQVRAISGSQSGEQTVDFWFVTETGLPVRMERTTRVESSSPVGQITYTEDGWWQIQSLQPAT
jgi:hypothetical protein